MHKLDDRQLGAKMVEIHWVDSYGLYGWRRQEEKEMEDHLSTIRTVALLLFEDAEQVVITDSMSRWSDHQPMAIPKCSIIKMWILKI